MIAIGRTDQKNVHSKPTVDRLFNLLPETADPRHCKWPLVEKRQRAGGSPSFRTLFANHVASQQFHAGTLA